MGGELGNDLAQGGQFSLRDHGRRTRVLKVTSREAQSGLRLRPGEPGEQSCSFQGALPSWSLRAGNRADRTSRDTQDQLRESPRAQHTRGTSLDNESMWMWGLGFCLIPRLAHSFFPTRGFKRPELSSTLFSIPTLTVKDHPNVVGKVQGLWPDYLPGLPERLCPVGDTWWLSEKHGAALLSEGGPSILCSFVPGIPWSYNNLSKLDLKDPTPNSRSIVFRNGICPSLCRKREPQFWTLTHTYVFPGQG